MIIKDIKKVLVVTLSNIGDIILTTPVLDIIKRELHNPQIDIVVSPQGACLFSNDPSINRVIIYQKKGNIKHKIDVVKNLQREKYDLAVDLKNSGLGFLSFARLRNSIFYRKPKYHMQHVHLDKLQRLGFNTENAKRVIHIGQKERDSIQQLLTKCNLEKPIILVNPSSKSHIKRWRDSYFADLTDKINAKYDCNIIFVGDKAEAPIVESVLKQTKAPVHNLCGKTDLIELAALLEKSAMLVTNDTATLHMAGAFPQLKILAIFGPTDPKKYGPMDKNAYIQLDLPCVPCEVARCRIVTHDCMNQLTVGMVYNKFCAIYDES